MSSAYSKKRTPITYRSQASKPGSNVKSTFRRRLEKEAQRMKGVGNADDDVWDVGTTAESNVQKDNGKKQDAAGSRRKGKRVVEEEQVDKEDKGRKKERRDTTTPNNGREARVSSTRKNTASNKKDKNTAQPYTKKKSPKKLPRPRTAKDKQTPKPSDTPPTRKSASKTPGRNKERNLDDDNTEVIPMSSVFDFVGAISSSAKKKRKTPTKADTDDFLNILGKKVNSKKRLQFAKVPSDDERPAKRLQFGKVISDDEEYVGRAAERSRNEDSPFEQGVVKDLGQAADDVESGCQIGSEEQLSPVITPNVDTAKLVRARDDTIASDKLPSTADSESPHPIRSRRRQRLFIPDSQSTASVTSETSIQPEKTPVSNTRTQSTKNGKQNPVQTNNYEIPSTMPRTNPPSIDAKTAKSSLSPETPLKAPTPRRASAPTPAKQKKVLHFTASTIMRSLDQERDWERERDEGGGEHVCRVGRMKKRMKIDDGVKELNMRIKGRTHVQGAVLDVIAEDTPRVVTSPVQAKQLPRERDNHKATSRLSPDFFDSIELSQLSEHFIETETECEEERHKREERDMRRVNRREEVEVWEKPKTGKKGGGVDAVDSPNRIGGNGNEIGERLPGNKSDMVCRERARQSRNERIGGQDGDVSEEPDGKESVDYRPNIRQKGRVPGDKVVGDVSHMVLDTVGESIHEPNPSQEPKNSRKRKKPSSDKESTQVPSPAQPRNLSDDIELFSPSMNSESIDPLVTQPTAPTPHKPTTTKSAPTPTTHKTPGQIKTTPARTLLDIVDRNKASWDRAIAGKGRRRRQLLGKRDDVPALPSPIQGGDGVVDHDDDGFWNDPVRETGKGTRSIRQPRFLPSGKTKRNDEMWDVSYETAVVEKNGSDGHQKQRSVRTVLGFQDDGVPIRRTLCGAKTGRIFDEMFENELVE